MILVDSSGWIEYFTHGLAMADAIVHATAQAGSIPMVTTDAHFEGCRGARVLTRRG